MMVAIYRPNRVCSTKITKTNVQMGRVDGYNPQNTRKDGAFTWTDIHVKDLKSSVAPGN